MRVLARLGKLFDALNKGLAFTGASILILMMLSVCYMVFLRYFMRLSVRGMFESLEYSVLYLTLLGAAWLLGKNGHVAMDIVISHLRPRTQNMLNLVTSILAFLMFLVLVWFSTDVTLRLFQTGTRIPGELYPPQGIIVGIIPIGSFLLAVESVRRALRFFSAWKENKG